MTLSTLRYSFWMWRSTIHLERLIKSLDRAGASDDYARMIDPIIGQMLHDAATGCATTFKRGDTQ